MLKFKNWRHSASLILVAKTNFTDCDQFNYKLLCLKRSSQSNFMPQSYVFPGGNTAKSDSDTQWLDLFKKHNIQTEMLEKLEPMCKEKAIYTPASDREIPKYVSLRICAIRETFEECGVLLCHSKEVAYDQKSRKWASYIGGPEIKQWQVKVNNDASEFLNLCKTFDIFPDIFALKVWSNWLTPVVYEKRFNTIFYIAALSQLPTACEDKNEIQKLRWQTPDLFLHYNKENKILLPVPQFYEISKFHKVPKIETLVDYACRRCEHGCEEYFPFRIDTPEGLYTILPGDELYPEIMDTSKTEVDHMISLPESTVKNRIFHKDMKSNKLYVENFKPKIEHLIPVDF